MKAVCLTATAAVTVALCIGFAAAARDASPTDSQDSAGGEVALTAAGSETPSACDGIRSLTQSLYGLPPKKVAKTLQKSLEVHLNCADWAVVMAGGGGGTENTVFTVNKGYNFWNSVTGQPVDDYNYICRNIRSVPAIAAGVNQRSVLYTAHDAMLGALFWRKKGDKPKLSEAEVREMVLASADKCSAGDNFVKCTFDDILATDEAPLAGVFAMWPPASIGFALSDPQELGLVQISYTYRLPKKPFPIVYIVQAM